jgi:dihydropteroate synthase
MLRVAGDLGVPIVTMHARGNAQTMESLLLTQAELEREGYSGIAEYVWSWLEKRAAEGLSRFAIPTWNVMIDPGLGFAKTNDQCLEIMAGLEDLVPSSHDRFRYPVLIGASRKRFVRQLCRFDVDTTTCATSAWAAASGAAMVRVHHVGAARDTLSFIDTCRRLRVKK